MSRFKVVVLFLLCGLPLFIFISNSAALPAYSDNSTSVNLTILSPDFSGLPTAFEGIKVELQNFNTTTKTYLTSILELILLLTLLIVALWRKEVFIYVVASLVTAFIAFDWIKLYTSLAICVGALTFYEVFEALRLAFFKKGESEKEESDSA